MPIANKPRKMRRTQISLPEAELRALQKVAANRRVSMSSVARTAIKKEIEREGLIGEKMFRIVGLGKGANPKGSEEHDEAIYS
jgi:hypothetical protein